MKTTFKELVAGELVNLLESTTAPQRKPETVVEKKEKPSKFPIEELKKLKEVRRGAIEHTYIDFIYEAIGTAFKDEKLVEAFKPKQASSSYLKFPVYTVVVPTANLSSHDQPLNKPCIITHGTNCYYLDRRGDVSRYTIRQESASSVKIATPEQILECVRELTDAQWKTIMSNDLFFSVREKAMNVQIEIITKG